MIYKRMVGGLMMCSALIASADTGIDDLLQQYRVKNDLSELTKQENQGHLTVFTREDLERMQAYRLKDVLKTIKTFTYQNNQDGFSAMARFTSPAGDGGIVRLSINDHDVASIFYGSAVATWGNMDLTHIDHIVIYQGGSAVSFGDEIGPMMIKLYTKTPERDNGSKVAVRYAPNSPDLSFYQAEDSEALSYFGYGHFESNDRKKYSYNGQELSRDYKNFSFFGTLQYDDAKLDIGGFGKKADNFIGIGMNNTTGDAESKIHHYFATYTKSLDSDDSLKLLLSVDHIGFDKYEYTPLGIDLHDGSSVTSIDHRHTEKVFSANLKKEWKFDKHFFVGGMQYKYKQFDIESHKLDGVESKQQAVGPDDETIWTLYGDWEYLIDDSHIVSLALKGDRYDRFGYREGEYVGRLGYTSLFNKQWRLKLFLSRSYLNPSFKQLVEFGTPFKGNPNLDPIVSLIGSGQLRYTDGRHTAWLKLVRKRVENGIMQNPAGMFVNSATIKYGNCYNVGYTLRYGKDDKLTFEYSKSTTGAPMIKSSEEGWFIRMFNRFGSLDVYNELIYRAGYAYGGMTVDDGYDYTAGVTYQHSEDMKFSIKGENILDKAPETPYSSSLPTIPAVDRRVIASMEYTF